MIRRLGERAGFLAAAVLAAVAFVVAAPAVVAPAFGQDVPVPLPMPNPERPPPPAAPAVDLIGPTLDGAPRTAGGDLPLPGGDPALPLNFLPNPGPVGNAAAPAGGGPLELVPNPNAPLDLLPIPNGATPVTPATTAAAAGPAVDFLLAATMTEGGTVIPSDIKWWVFGENPGRDGTLPLVAQVDGGAVRVNLSPGFYLVQAVYGRATATTRIEVGPAAREKTIALNAGGLRLRAVIGDEIPIPPADLRFEVLMAGDAGDRTVITDNAGPDQIIRLSAGPYQIISYYGDTNAIVRADITVTAGQLTDVTLYHQAARVTLKLVTSRGGEALANTAWSVVTEGGEIVFDSVGAFPSLILAAGDYTAIAKHGDEVFESPFTVAAGLNRDVEVLAENPIQPTTVVP